MHDGWVRLLLGIALLLCAAFGLGLLTGTAGGLALGSAALFCAIAWRMKALQARGHYEPNPVANPFDGAVRACRRLVARVRAAVRGRRRPAAEAPPYGVCVLDRDYELVWCNASAAAHFGLRAGTATGKPFIHAAALGAYVAAGDFTKPLRLPAAPGSRDAVLSLSLVPYLKSQWLLLSRDVTLDARAESARREAVADALHELCTPITVLAGYLEALARLRADSRKTQEYLCGMEAQCRRLQRTVGDLLDVWTLDSAPPHPRHDRVAVAPMLEAIGRDMEALSQGRHRIVLDVEPDLEVLGAAGELESAFCNLAANAVRYTPAGGEVRIAWHAVPGGAEYSVTDTGIGIAPEHLPRLTERFYRVSRDRSSRSGTGLGLAIVKDVLERHQAELRIESRPGVGSRFTARFPSHRVLASGEPDAEEDPASARPAADASLAPRFPALGVWR